MLNTTPTTATLEIAILLSAPLVGLAAPLPDPVDEAPPDVLLALAPVAPAEPEAPPAVETPVACGKLV